MAVAKTPLLVGRSGEATLRLLHFSISRRHATVTRTGDGWTVEDHDSRFGTFVNGTRVRSSFVRPGDRVQFGSAISYRVEAGGLRLDVTAEGMELYAAGLTLSVPQNTDFARMLGLLVRLGPAEGKADGLWGKRRPLVRDISFQVRPDSFVGILGPSGVGKSTVLNCLAGYRVPDQGRLVFDGHRDVHAEPDDYRALMGHVPQDDIVYRTLTVRENLAYAARLRLGTGLPGVTIEEAVGEAVGRAGLAEHAEKSAGVLSGGQRKRLSVAIELLRRPRLLLLDEPTSGLDPASEAHLMEQLRHLARRGTTVICTTHLMDNLRLLDEVLVLGRRDGVGRLAYAGPPEGLQSHFGCRHFADLYEALESGRFEPVEPPRGESPDPAPEPMTTSGGRMPAGARSLEPGSDTSLPVGVADRAGIAAVDAGRRQFPTVTRRALVLLLRDRALVVTMLAQPVVLGLLVCLTQYDVETPLPLLFFAVVVAIWLGLNHAARDLVRERRLYIRDRLAGLAPGAYLGAKVAVHSAAGAVQLLILLAILRLVGGQVLQFEVAAMRLAETSTLRLFLVLMACYLGGVGLGLLTSTLARTEEAAVATLPLLIMPQLLLSVVATGMQARRYDEPRPFRPLVVTVHDDRHLPAPAALVDGLSLACLSRPAALVAESPRVPGYGEWAWLGDLCHLLILLLTTWFLLLLAFGRAERRWLRLLGL